MTNRDNESVFGALGRGQCWEDLSVAAEALAIGPDDDLACVTAGGDDALTLALERPRSITVVATTAAHRALLELKLAAVRTLDWHHYVAFLGARRGGDRVATYRRVLRPCLGDEARRLFDANERVVAGGVIHGGRVQRSWKRFRTALLPLIHNRATVEEFMTLADRDERARYYERAWDNRRWGVAFPAFAHRAVTSWWDSGRGRSPRRDRILLGEELLRRTRWAMIETCPRENHFLQYAMLGRYPDLERGPRYLRESVFAELRAASEVIRVVDGGARPDAWVSRGFSRLYLSSSLDGPGAVIGDAVLSALVGAARPGARLVYWTVAERRTVPGSLAASVTAAPILARALQQHDLAWIYGALHVDSVT
jgi:S-adenosylmethionine-diacylglycerol 3-amino-3-carboxypropyl transferase